MPIWQIFIQLVIIFINLSLLGSASIIVNLQSHGGASCNFFMFWMHRRKPVNLSNSRHICHVQFHFLELTDLEGAFSSWISGNVLMFFFPALRTWTSGAAGPKDRVEIWKHNSNPSAERSTESTIPFIWGRSIYKNLYKSLPTIAETQRLKAFEGPWSLGSHGIGMRMECPREFAERFTWVTECSFEMWVLLQDRYIHSMSSPWMCLCWMFVESGIKLDWSQLTWNWTVRSCFTLCVFLQWVQQVAKSELRMWNGFIGNCRWNQRATLRLRDSEQRHSPIFVHRDQIAFNKSNLRQRVSGLDLTVPLWCCLIGAIASMESRWQ